MLLRRWNFYPIVEMKELKYSWPFNNLGLSIYMQIFFSINTVSPSYQWVSPSSDLTNHGSQQLGVFFDPISFSVFGCFFLTQYISQKKKNVYFSLLLKSSAKIWHLWTQIVPGSNLHVLHVLTRHWAHPPARTRALVCLSPPSLGSIPSRPHSCLFAAWSPEAFDCATPGLQTW